ncbi:MAG: response regulator [Nitrospirota bacterium]
MAHRLLLADDSITIQKVVELILADEGFEIKATNNGAEALSVIPSFKPDIVLADIEMPKINGYQLCEKIKQDPSMRGMPVILLAGAFEPIDKELAKQVKADDFVIKPFESQELIGKIRAALIAPFMVEGEKVEGIAEAEAVRVEEMVVKEEPRTMREIPEITEVKGLTAEETIEVSTEEVLGITEQARVAAEAVPKETIPPVVEKAIAQKVVIEVELLSKDELKEMFEKTVSDRVSSLLASLDVKEAMTITLMPLMKDSIEKIIGDVTPEVVKGIFEKTVSDRISPLLSSLDVKEAMTITLMPLMKDSIEKITGEVGADLVERMLKEMLVEVEKVMWKTIPDLAETMISKEIERIRSEF